MKCQMFRLGALHMRSSNAIACFILMVACEALTLIYHLVAQN